MNSSSLESSESVSSSESFDIMVFQESSSSEEVEDRAEFVAQGVFESEYGALQAQIVEQKKRVTALQDNQDNPPTFIARHRGKITLISGLIVTATLIAAISTGPQGFRVSNTTLIYTAGGFLLVALVCIPIFIFHGRIHDREEVNLSAAKLSHRKMVQRDTFLVEESFNTEKFTEAWDKFEENPTDNQALQLCEKFSKLSLVDRAAPLSLMDEIGSRLSTGEIVMQWKEIKAGGADAYSVPHKLWRTVNLPDPSPDDLRNFLNNANPKSILRVINDNVKNAYKIAMPENV